MKQQLKLADWVELIGIAAVVVSLVLVAWELRRSNSLARASVHSDLNQHVNQLNLEVASNADFAEFQALLRSEPTELSSSEVERAEGLAFFLRNVWINGERAYEEGWIDRNKFQAYLNDIDYSARTWPGLKPYLRGIVDFYEKDRELTLVEKRILEVTTSSP